MVENGMLNLILLPINAYFAGVFNHTRSITINLVAVGLNLGVIAKHLLN
jgi:hypothetical protein